MQQNTVKASAYGSEYIALRIAKEMIEALWYKSEVEDEWDCAGWTGKRVC